MTGLALISYSILGIAVIQMAVMVIRDWSQNRVRRTFASCLSAARAEGIEPSFMNRVCSTASLGDALDQIILQQGSYNIKQCLEEARSLRCCGS